MANEQPGHQRAYAGAIKLTLASLITIDTPEKAQAFVTTMSKRIRELATKVPEFYIAEFVQLLQDAVKKRGSLEVARYQRTIVDAKAEAEQASAELTARFHAARAANDTREQHAIFREREVIQKAVQTKIDEVTKQAKLEHLRLEAYQSLASALGVTSTSSSTYTKPSTTAVIPPASQKTPVAASTPASPPVSAASLDDLLVELNGLIGLAPVKTDVRQLIDMAQVEQMRRKAGLPVSRVSRHLVFTGNPGTGKTTVARLLARLYTAIGILRTGQLVEASRSDLVAGYVGQTAIKTTETVKRALGGILFIDEAYSLSRLGGSGQDYGQEAIDTLVKLMEDHRDELVVIVAGYGDEMSHFIHSNPGLPSRFPRTINFPDYSTYELISIFESMCAQDRYEVSADAIQVLHRYLEALPRSREFGNGRLVRNIFEAAIARQASRIIATKSSDLTKLLPADLGLPASPPKLQTDPYL